MNTNDFEAPKPPISVFFNVLLVTNMFAHFSFSSDDLLINLDLIIWSRNGAKFILE